MNKRIRYVAAGGSKGGFVSAQYIKSSFGKEYLAYIRGNTGQISEVGNFDIIGDYLATSSHKIKILLKDKLIELGCEFEPETRKKNK